MGVVHPLHNTQNVTQFKDGEHEVVCKGILNGMEYHQFKHQDRIQSECITTDPSKPRLGNHNSSEREGEAFPLHIDS